MKGVISSLPYTQSYITGDGGVAWSNPSALIAEPGWGSHDAGYMSSAISGHEFSHFDPSGWTNANLVAQHIAGLWDAQAKDLADFAKVDEPAALDWLYLLYLLTGLSTSPNGDQAALAAKIAGLPTAADAIVFPNDRLATVLVYHALLTWIDPLGTFKWPATQLATVLQTLSDAMPNGGALRDAADKHAAILKGVDSYPMLDPYYPSIGFDVRKADVLQTLVKTWQPRPR
jgi:hypothetical protein